MELNITGIVEVTFTDLDGNEVTNEVKQEIVSKLQEREYTIGLATKTVCSFENLKPIYLFDFEVNDFMEYEFDGL